MEADEPAINVVLADDHVVVRRGLRLLLEREPGISVLAEASDAGVARDAALARGANVLLLDLNMPGRPLEVLAELESGPEGIAAVVLTMERDPAFARRALDAGARGYVLKGSADGDLIAAIRAAAGGGTYVSPALKAPLARSRSGSGDELTARETEILRLIARGHTNAEIAELLGLSVRTVESHRTRVRRKLGAADRAGLVRYALDNELI